MREWRNTQVFQFLSWGVTYISIYITYMLCSQMAHDFFNEYIKKYIKKYLKPPNLHP